MSCWWCCSQVLRFSFLAVALPCLLLGSLLSQVAVQLQLQSVNHLKYAAGEATAAVFLTGAAEQSAAAAVEQETEALELQAQAAKLQGESKEAEEAAIQQREQKAGVNTNEGAGAAAEAQEGETLATAVDSAAEAAATSEAAAANAATATAGGAATDAAAAAGGSAAAAGTEAAGTAAAGAEAASAAAVTAAEAGGTAAAEAATVEAASGVAGPVGLAVAGAGVVAASQAPKAVAALKGLSSEVEADRDEVMVVEKEAQVGALEADSVIEEDGAVVAGTAAARSIALAGSYFVAAQVFQTVAFVLEAPVAFVVLSQWLFSGLTAVTGGAVCMASTPGIAAARCGASATLVVAIGSLLLVPWSDTVVFAAEELGRDPVMTAIEQLPELWHAATANRTKSKRLKVPGLNATQQLWAATSTQKSWSSARLSASSQAHRRAARSAAAPRRGEWSARRLSEVGRAMESIGGMLGNLANDSKDVAQMGADEAGKAFGWAYNATSKAVPGSWKAAANKTEVAVGTAVAGAANSAKKTAIRWKNGNPDVATTTVKPREAPAPPADSNHLGLLGWALAACLSAVCYWALPVLKVVILLSCAVAVVEFAIAYGRHTPSLQAGGGRISFSRLILADVCSSWMAALAVLVGAFLVGILLAKHLAGVATWVQTQVHTAPWFIAALQVLICLICLLASGLLSYLLATQGTPDGEREPGSAQDEESQLLEVNNRDFETSGRASPGKGYPEWWHTSSLACFVVFAIGDALLAAMERPVTAWALGGAFKSFLTISFMIGLLPWAAVAPTILGFKPSSPYLLLAPVAAVSLLVGALLVFVRRRAR